MTGTAGDLAALLSYYPENWDVFVNGKKIDLTEISIELSKD